MNPTHDFVTVDMRGLKAALVARAQAERVSVSVLVRDVVARDLGVTDAAEPLGTVDPIDTVSSSTRVKLSIRITFKEIEQLPSDCRRSSSLKHRTSTAS